MRNKKEPLSIIAVKTLLAVIIFAGVGTIIVGGEWLIGNYSKVSNDELAESTKLINSQKEIGNPVADYLENAELQCGTENRKKYILSALNDILILSEEQLKVKRYEDYTGKKNQWDLSTLIYRHFVPEYPGVTLGDNFFHDIKSKETEKQIRIILEKYKISPDQSNKYNNS